MMVFNLRAWLFGLITGAALAAVIAAIPTGLDVSANPGEVFRDVQGMNWGAVLETFSSWWLPLLSLVAPLTVLGFAWREGLRKGDRGCSDCG